MSFLSNIVNKVKNNFSDDKGFFRGNKFTPVTQLSGKPLVSLNQSRVPSFDSNNSSFQSAPQFPTLEAPKPSFKTNSAERLNSRLEMIKNFGTSAPIANSSANIFKTNPVLSPRVDIPKVPITNFWDKGLGKGLVRAQETVNNQIDIQKRDFKDLFWQPLKENSVLTPSMERFEKAVPSLKTNLEMGIKDKNVRYNPFQNREQKQKDFQDVQNYRQGGQGWQDTKNIGLAALTAYGLAKLPIQAVLGGAAINPLIKLGTNMYDKKYGNEITTRENDNFQFPDFENSAPGQELRADLNFTNKSNKSKTYDIVFHIEGNGINIAQPQTKETLQPGEKMPYGLQLNIPKNVPVGNYKVYATVNGEIVSGTEKTHKILNTTATDRYNRTSDDPNDLTIKRGTIIKQPEKSVMEGVVNSIPEGAGQGLANAGTTRLTNSLVQSLSAFVPILRPLTEKAITAGAPVVTDTLKQGAQKFFATGGKRLLKAAVIETAVESPIWATLTQTDQETYLQALTREAQQNLVMNIGMAGVNTVSDSRALTPIIKKSIGDAVDNYWKSASTPEAIKGQGGYIDFMGNTIDGTDRTNRFNNLVDTYYKPNATSQQKIDSYAELRRLATDVFGNNKIKQLTSGLNEDPENLIKALSDTLEGDIKTNKGYKEPFTIRNFLDNKELQRGGMDLTDKTKSFPQQPIKTGGDVKKTTDIPIGTKIEVTNPQMAGGKATGIVKEMTVGGVKSPARQVKYIEYTDRGDSGMLETYKPEQIKIISTPIKTGGDNQIPEVQKINEEIAKIESENPGIKLNDTSKLGSETSPNALETTIPGVVPISNKINDILPNGISKKGNKPITEILPDKKSLFKKITNAVLGDKEIEGSLGVIKNDSDAGDKIYKTIRASQQEADDLSGLAQDNIRKSIKSLTTEEKSTFSDVIEGKMKAVSGNQQIAVNQWKTISKEIRDAAVKNGMKVGNIENYFPHFIKKDGVPVLDERFMFNRATDKNYGNLVKSRKGNADFEKNPEVLFSYIKDSYDNIIRQKYFGKADSNLYNLANKTNNPSQVKSYLDQILDKNQPKGVFSKITNAAQQYQTVTKLNFTSSLTNLTQNLSTAMRTSQVNVAKAIKFSISNPEEALSRAVRASEVGPDMEKAFADYTGTGTIASKWIHLIGMGGKSSSEELNRIIAVNSGYIYAKDLNKKALKGSKSAIRELGRFNITSKDIKNGVSEEQLIRAGRQVSKETQFSTSAGELPYAAKTELGKPLTQFKSFAYKQTGFVKNNLKRIFSEATKLNFAPLATALTVYGITAPIVGEIINDVKSIFKNKKRVDEGFERYLNNITGATSLGILDSLPGLTGQYGESGVISAIGGPTVSDIKNTIKGVSDLKSGLNNYDSKKTFFENIDPNKTTRRNFLKQIPAFGPTIANTIVPNPSIENYFGVNNGLNEPDKKTYDNLVASGNESQAEAFKTKNNYINGVKDKKTNIIEALFNKKTEVKALSTNPTPQEIRDYNTEIDKVINAGGVPTDEQIKLRLFRNPPKDVKTSTKVFTTVKSIYDDPELTDEYKQAVLKNSGLDESEFNYYQSASLDNSERQQLLVNLSQKEDRNEVIQAIIQSKKLIGGKALASSTDVNYLYDQGLISKDEKKLIDSWKFDETKGEFYQDRDYKASGSSGAAKTKMNKMESARKALDTDLGKSSKKGSNKAVSLILGKRTKASPPVTIGNILKSTQFRKKSLTQKYNNTGSIKKVKRQYRFNK